MPAFLSLHQAIAEQVPDGAPVAVEGFTHLIPFAAGHEVVRQLRRDLTLIRMTVLVMLKPEQAFRRGVPEMADSTLGWRFAHPELVADLHTVSLGETAEKFAERRGSLASSKMNWRSSASRSGRRQTRRAPRPGVMPTPVPAGRRGETVAVTEDEHHPRDLGLQRLARVVGTAVAAVRPDETGLRPIPACRKALQRAGLDVNDMQIVELNEAFASQAIACLDDLSIHWRDEARVNPNGGAIGLGHPLGGSGVWLRRRWDAGAGPTGQALRPGHYVYRCGPGHPHDPRATDAVTAADHCARDGTRLRGKHARSSRTRMGEL
ncbi:MAG: hypothetical protein JO023_28000 [Chloroflexi bacterium]|nr:hypothetical protein [Chloroflexota bacterium]